MINRTEQARHRGYASRVDNKPITDNYYINLGTRYQALAGHWEAGWNEADKEIETINLERVEI